MLTSFFGRCFRRCFLLPCMERRHDSPSPQKSPLLSPSATAIETPQREFSAVVADESLAFHSDSTWNLDLLFSGSYLFNESSGATDDKLVQTRRRGKAYLERPPKIVKPRPTHFLAVRINSPQILEAVCRAQEEMVERLPAVRGAIIPASKLHVTLSVLYLPKREDVEAVKECLSKCSWPSDCPPALHLHGVGHFRDSVIYAGVRPGDGADALKSVAAAAIGCIKQTNPSALLEEEEQQQDVMEAGGQEECQQSKRKRKSQKNDREFHPHVTVAKVTRPGNFRKKGGAVLRKIDRNAHAHLADHYFGEQTWDRVQLLAMQWPSCSRKKAEVEEEEEEPEKVLAVATTTTQNKSDGYYFVETEVFLASRRVEEEVE